jgi:phosphatidate cytidylyltransferase
MNEHETYRLLIDLLFIAAFTFDSASYFFGSIFGRYKLWPKISPGKTLEGVVGGYVCTLFMIMFTLYQKNMLQNISFHTLALSTAIICAIGLFGDFFESLLKRQAGLKDTGSILPGHGGFLDRFDSVMMISYAVFLAKAPILACLMRF